MKPTRFHELEVIMVQTPCLQKKQQTKTSLVFSNYLAWEVKISDYKPCSAGSIAGNVSETELGCWILGRRELSRHSKCALVDHACIRIIW